VAAAPALGPATVLLLRPGRVVTVHRAVGDRGIRCVIGLHTTRHLLGDVGELEGDPVAFRTGMRPSFGPRWKDNVTFTVPLAHRSSPSLGYHE
jgi:hypothetical protein